MPFPTTRWSLLAQATIHGGAAQREALAEFYRRYRDPVVGFVRRQCRNPTEADDLRAWLAGRPIAARPVSAWGRGWSWARRNPALAGLALALGLTLVVGTTVLAL